MKKILTLGGLIPLLSMLSAVTAMAQDKDLAVVPANQFAPVDLRIQIDKATVAIGDFVSFSFTSSADGYATLWDVGTSGKVTRIYPNRLGGDMRVKADVPYGAGGPHDNFAFKVGGPPGMEDVYLVWTRRPEVQPEQFDYADATSLAKDLTVVERLDRADWATVKVTFEITPDGRPQTARIMNPQATASRLDTNVYILAIGANVKGLTKTNADARHFVTTMQRLFEVPQDHIRLLENAYRRDFATAMDWLQEQANPGDLVLIFFSGHGSTINDDNGDETDQLDEVFVMYDAEGATYPSAQHVVRDDEFAGWTNELKTDQVITFIDACHSGGLQKSLTNARTKFFIGGELGRLPGAASWPQKAMQLLRKDLAGGIDGSRSLSGMQSAIKGLVYAAAQEDEYALEVADGGLFITRFLQHVSEASDINLAELFAQTRRTVQQESKGQQTPVAVGETNLGENVNLTIVSR